MKHLHEKRGVTFQELGALIGVKAMLEDGLIVHHTSEHAQDLPTYISHGFNMAVACSTADCASVGCIGGSMAMLMGKNRIEAMQYVGLGGVIGEASPAFQNLFFPPEKCPPKLKASLEGYDEDRGDSWWVYITAKQTIQAIENWLKDGKPRWAQICNHPLP